MREDTMGNAEMAILAAQARANISRLRDFNAFPDDLEASFDAVDAALRGMVEPIATMRPPSYNRNMSRKTKTNPLDAISGIASDCRLPCAHSLETAERLSGHARTLEPGPLRDAQLGAAFEMAYVARHLGVVLAKYEEQYLQARRSMGLEDVEDGDVARARASGEAFMDMHVRANAIMELNGSLGEHGGRNAA